MNETVIASTKDGKLRGFKYKAKILDAEFYSFYGVPYGEAPIKHLRFKDPVKVKPWKSIRDATKENKSGCTQFAPILKMLCGSEDCLYMNIHTQQMPSKGMPLKPVIVYLHPGGYRFGSPETWHHGNPDFVMRHDVVYVCIAHRLHIFGFLNLNMKECSGNQGLKDVILALKWIKDNIYAFNGDADNVTLFGGSSGGGTINLLMMSPAAKGLFHKGVMPSPAIPFTVYIRGQDDNANVAFQLGHILGFQGDDRKKLLNFLKTLPGEILTTTQRALEQQLEEQTASVFPSSVFLPSIDSASEFPVLPIPLRNLIQTVTAVPLILGMCERESIVGFVTETEQALIGKNYKTGYRQNSSCWMQNLNDNDIKSLNEQVERFYLKDRSFEDAALPVKVDMITEIIYHDLYDTIINPVAEQLPSSVYLYKYKLDTDMGMLKRFIPANTRDQLSGTYHADDLSCWVYFGQELSQKNVQIINTYTKLITTFAKNGDPNYEELGVRWKPTTVEKPCYLCIDEELQMIDGRFHNESVEFWENIKKQFKKD